MVKFSVIQKYNGLFKNCTVESGVDGLSVFDANNDFMGFIHKNGFLIEGTYPHKDKITSMLREKGIKVFDYDTFQKEKNEKQLAEALYGEPE